MLQIIIHLADQLYSQLDAYANSVTMEMLAEFKDQTLVLTPSLHHSAGTHVRPEAVYR